ncbi:tRNA pseudouridine(55) synthase TruB [Falsibacillus pallidus]|uniref:tRNA pseudouridine synthase B n=1 Tax=Falsibacillus pallidus TaxID=493781 RepID=A0A370GUP8_9BACI|nr:tRNA pseudouridine(55) synthase TruB [Falsibacillus pallidus]RDI47412.1 tRNA pseudouridine synthase B [Falsibacillus pallidus]
MDGILPLWKTKGMTSHDCVFKVRKILGMKKVGHTGTLDPDVTGVLPICLGRATKLSDYIMNAGKTYEGEVTLGFSTTTEDASGEIVDSRTVNEKISKESVLGVLSQLTGEIQQTPPMYSAVKVNGKKLYEYARAGIEVERPTRTVHVYSLELIGPIQQEEETVRFRFNVSCSKGTYIRTLAVTIGELLGYPAHMSDLMRTSSGSFTEEDCITLEQLKEMTEKGIVEEAIYPLERGISHLPIREISDTLAEKVKNGAVLESTADLPDAHEWVFTEHGQALAIYQPHPTKAGMIKPVKVLRIE